MWIETHNLWVRDMKALIMHANNNHLIHNAEIV